MPGQPDPEHLDFPSLELLQATAHEGAGEGYPFMEYHTQPWVWASDVSPELAFDEVSFDMAFAYHDTYRSIEPCETVRASLTRGSKADDQGDTAKDSPSFPAAATAFSLGDSLDVTINSTHLATSTAITTKEYPSRQVSLPDMAADTTPSHGCFDDLSEDELHGPSLYPVVRPKRSNTVRQTGHAVRCRIPSTCHDL